MHTLVLFDIDGTLVLTGGAGVRALARTVEAVAGRPAPFDCIPLAGRTDWVILKDAMQRVGTELHRELFRELRDQYLVFLREEIELPGRSIKAVMPGVRDLLERLRARDDVWLGLVTGNVADAARIKLEHFDLWRYFCCGAFGDDAEERNALVPFAIERARREGLPEIAANRVIVVGDTPLDVACALAAGAVPVGVATGGYTVEQLRHSGAGVVFTDLSDGDAFCALL